MDLGEDRLLIVAVLRAGFAHRKTVLAHVTARRYLARLVLLHSGLLALQTPPSSLLVVDVPFEFFYRDFAGLWVTDFYSFR